MGAIPSCHARLTTHPCARNYATDPRRLRMAEASPTASANKPSTSIRDTQGTSERGTADTLNPAC